MEHSKPLVVIGLLGTSLDRGTGVQRWERWRPSVALCQHDDLVVSRFELVYPTAFQALAAHVQDDIGHVSPETVVRLHADATPDAWDFESVYASLHDFARAYPFDPDREDYLVHITTGSHVAQICLFLLTESRHIPGRLVQTSPPRRTRGIAPGAYQVIDLDLSRYDRIASRFATDALDERAILTSGIETRNAAFQALVAQLDRVATRSAAPVLLLGPTGAGKSRMARRIYDLKKARRRVRGPLVEVNCATIRGDAAMSALFGHVRGAFTGAAHDRPGLLRTADQGVLFLDEIGELGRDEQAMLLRALEEKRFLPLGGDREVSSDFQLIAGTNRDLAQAVRDGRFRDDLLARINLWTFRLPGLAERPEDIAPNLAYELEQFRQRTGDAVTISAEARALFLEFAEGPEGRWPGNFRDLAAVTTRLATLAPGGRITVGQVQAEMAALRALWGTAPAGGRGGPSLVDVVLPDGQGADLDRFDRVQLEDVLAVCRTAPTLSAAGRALFERTRARKQSVNDADRLRKYLLRFGLEWAGVKAALSAPQA